MMIYLCILLAFLLWTLFNSCFIPALKEEKPSHFPLVSVLVPLRNEERNAQDLVHMLQKLTYPNIEFFLLDDGSQDRTKELLLQAIGNDQRFSVLDGAPLPEGWSGKVHACHQLSLKANGEYFLFLDADVRLAKSIVESSLALLMKKNAALVTGFPRFPVVHLLEKWLVPMQHFLVYFHLPFLLANFTVIPSSTAAHGAFLLFHAGKYRKAGGHESIKDSLVDDVHIAVKIKKGKEKVILANITRYAACFMYSSNREVWEGFRKNVFPGFGRSFLLAGLMTLFYSVFYLLPGFLLLAGIVQLIFRQEANWLLFLPYIIIVLQKAYIDWRTGQKLSISLWMPAIAGTFLALLYASMGISIKKQGYTWKGRTYD
ncbi:glycosyltransferase [Metabacillus sp. GX 13764]|uniref:glycosyltransferase n=1 Tax=Metabacillus kandeliae TaxID=2900151 RepID=UPI001E29CEF7|nr:glycosyltransferase family 2 protein [Metabacillus kandeliae]MCD7036122.1 glycosyltransferase [Metabacillus kandeliae]